MKAQNAQEDVLVVCAVCDGFDEVNVWQCHCVLACQPVNYVNRECCVPRKSEMWRFLIVLNCLYTVK